MDPPVSIITIAAGLYALTLLSGIWLSLSGKPYKVGIFNVHKLVALAAVVITAVTVIGLYRMVGSPTLLALILIAASGLSLLALFVTGALMGITPAGPILYLRIHQVAPILALLTAGSVFYLLLL